MKHILLGLSLLLCLHCTTPKHSFKKHDYNKAFELAIKRLNHGSTKSKHLQILLSSLDELAHTYSLEKARLLDSSDVDSQQQALNINEYLLQLFRQAEDYMTTAHAEEYQQLQTENISLQKRLAQDYFRLGNSLLDTAILKYDKILARKAYHKLSRAKEYGNTNPRLDNILTRSFKFAQIRINVLTSYEGNNVKRQTYLDKIFKKIEQEQVAFRLFFYRYEKEFPPIDCTLHLRFSPANINESESRSTDSYSEEVIARYEITQDTSGNHIETPIYEEVSASVTTTTRRKTASWSMEIEVEAHTSNCSMGASSYSAFFEEEEEDISITGDERALPMGVSNKSGWMLPSNHDMLQQIAQQSYRQFVQYCQIGEFDVGK